MSEASLRVVWKEDLEVSSYFIKELPAGAEILHVSEQSGLPVMWFLADPTETRKEKRKLAIKGTGMVWNSGENLVYLGTVQTPPFVWHVFEDMGDDNSV